MTKKEIKSFFQAIREHEIQKVKDLINTDKDYLKVCNFSPPKQDDGQSGLQVAFKTGNFEIAEFLINEGAEVNFSEKSEINEWTAPVLHDCIRATIFNSYTLQKDLKEFEIALSLLKLMLHKQADPSGIDSYGNNSFHRAILDSRQMIIHPNVDMKDGILLTQLRNVFNELIIHGADPDNGNDKRPSPRLMLTNFRLEQYELKK